MSIYTCVPQMTTIWCMVPEILSATDIIFCHLRPFFVLLPHPLKTQKMKISKKWKHLEIPLIFFILANFLLFYPPNSPKNENFIKKRKKSLELSSFYTSVPKVMIICYTVLEIWSVTDVIVIFHSGVFFYLFTLLTAQKI